MFEHPLPLIKQLDNLDDDPHYASGYTGSARWMIPYADLLTLLLGVFVLLYASVQIQQHKIVPQNPVAPQDVVKQFVAQAHQNPVQAKQLEHNLMKALQLKGQQISVRQDPRGLVISMQDRLFFEPGSSELTPEAEKTLDQLAGILKDMPQSIRVEGHTDNTPIHTAQFPSNWELSTMRATTIVKNLIEKHQFSPKRLSAAGFAEFYPQADNSTIEGKQKNRRVDIVLISADPAPTLDSGSDKPTINKK